MRPWGWVEEQALGILLPYLGVSGCAAVFERTEYAIRRKANRLGKPVKKKHEINVADLSQEALDHLTKRAPRLICPACGRRLVTSMNLGLCAVCHKVALTEAHNERLAELAAHREYNAAKQRLRRKRREMGVTAPRISKRKEAQRHEEHDSETERALRPWEVDDGSPIEDAHF